MIGRNEKRLLAYMLAVLMLFSFSACQKSGSEQSEQGAQTEQTETSESAEEITSKGLTLEEYLGEA